MTFLYVQRFVRIVFSVLAVSLLAAHAAAHEPFDISSRLMIYDDRLELIVTLGTDGVRQLLSDAGRSPEEIEESLKSRGPDVPVIQPTTLAAQVFRLKSHGELLVADSVKSVSEGAEILLTLRFSRPPAGTLEIQATCYETIAGLRRGVLVVEDEIAGQLDAGLLSPTHPQAVIQLPERAVRGAAIGTMPAAGAEVRAPASPPANRASLGTFFMLGVEHILIGIDHLLFLVVLLIGVHRLASMLGIITCFTLAHSVTLALAALELVTISSRIVEPLIAVSIIVVCVVNFVRRHAEGDRVWLAGGFGLIHGFGFASVLRETGLAQGGDSVGLPLLSFNLGVETGQLAIAAIFLPLLFLGRRSPGFVRYGLPAISAGVIGISGYWLVERIFF